MKRIFFGNRRVRERGLLLCSALSAPLIGLTVAANAGLRVNTTASMPLGLWRATAPHELHRGDVIIFCAPDVPAARVGRERGYIGPGRCPGDGEPLIKPVIATAGDAVRVEATGLSVNGISLPGTAQMWTDSRGRLLSGMASGTYRVAPCEVWAASSVPQSFDSRYWGPLLIGNVQSIALPLWVTR